MKKLLLLSMLLQLFIISCTTGLKPISYTFRKYVLSKEKLIFRDKLGVEIGTKILPLRIDTQVIQKSVELRSITFKKNIYSLLDSSKVVYASTISNEVLTFEQDTLYVNNFGSWFSGDTNNYRHENTYIRLK
jgi:hypothetical protein